MIDQKRIRTFIEGNGGSADEIMEMSEMNGGTLIVYEGASMPFDGDDVNTEVIGYEEDQDHYLKNATGVIEGIHFAYVMRHRVDVGQFDPESRYDGSIWIGGETPPPAVIAWMDDVRYARMFGAISTWMTYARMMLDKIPRGVPVPSGMEVVMDEINRRMASDA